MACEIDIFGFELLQKLHHDDIRKKEDVIILFVHWYFTKSGFRCVGIGDKKEFDESEKGSEVLPKDWNTRLNYALRYVKNGKLYILIGLKSDADLLLNLVKQEEDSISNIQFPIEKTVSALHGPLEIIIPSYETMLHNLNKDFVSIIYPKSTKDATTQTISESSDSTDSQNLQAILRDQPSSVPFRNPALDPARVGVRDLDPFSPGGGMIYDPFNDRSPVGRYPGLGVPGRLPSGAVPPGARFDPFGPPDLNPRRPRRGPDDPFCQGAFFPDII